MKSIKSVKIIHQSMGLHCSYDIKKHKIDIHKTGFVKHSLYNGVSNRPVQVFKYKVENSKMTEFLNFLEPITTTWESDYSVEVLDGWEWEFNVKYYIGQPRK